jgi:uncharacterized protein YjdB
MLNITLSHGLSEILEGTFSGCTSLKNLTLLKEINTIGNFAFNNCTALKTFIFEDKSGNYNLGIGGTTSAKTGLFKTCGLDSVYVGGALKYATTSPTYSPFYQNTSLRSIRFTDKENKIYSREFYGCTKLENIWMGPTIDDIGSYAFSGCKALKKVTVGPAVVQLGEHSFYGCSALKQIDLSNVSTIKNNAFQSCTTLPQIHIPLSTTSIENQAFKSCTSLKNIIIEDRTAKLTLGINAESTNYKGITGAGTPIFSDCPLDSVYIGGPIEYSKTLSSGYSPFFYNESLRSVFITNKEKQVYTNEFYNCLGLQRIKLGDGVTKINELGFQSCTGLLYFEFASTLQSIGADAFSDCNNIKTIISHATIPPVVGEQGLEDINFWECTLYVPEGSESAYQEADQWKNFFITPMKRATGISLDKTEYYFFDINETITLVATVVPSDVMDSSVTWSSSNPAVATVDNNGTVTSMAAGTATITATTNDGTNLSASCQITVSVSNITFADANVKAICIQNWDTNDNEELSESEAAAVTSLGTAFRGNTEITSFDELRYFTGLTEICDSAFYNCTALTSVSVPENVISSGRFSFQGCTGLTKAEFANIESLCGIEFKTDYSNPLQYAHHLYIDNEEISNLVIPTSITSIKNYTFYNCSSLNSVTFHDGITYIGNCAFAGCSGLSEIVLPNGLRTIGSGAFYRCTGLTNVIIPEGVKEIGESFSAAGSFRECTSLNHVVIPEGVEVIRSYTFYDCTSLNHVVIPKTVTEIEECAFSVPGPLTVTIYAEIPPTTDGWAFLYNNTFTRDTLYVPKGCKAAYEAANNWKKFKVIIENIEFTAGDVNSDNAVDVSDYMTIANYILGQAPTTFNEAAADVTQDNNVDVADYMGVANIILFGNYQGPQANSANGIKALAAEQTSPWMGMVVTEDGLVELHLHDTPTFSAFQMDIFLPEGIEIYEANMSKAKQTRNLSYAQLQSGAWRLLYGTLESKTVNLADRSLLTLKLTSKNKEVFGGIDIEDITLVKPNSSAIHLSNVHGLLPTGISDIEGMMPTENNNYDLTGRKVTESHLKKGIYIINGKKVSIK